MSTSSWGPVATVLAAVIGAVVLIYVSRRSKAGDERTVQMQANEGIASGYSLLTRDQREWMAQQDKAIKELRTDRDQDRLRITDLESRLDKIGRRYRDAVAYIRILLAFIATNVQGVEPPPMPNDLTLDLD